MLIKLFQNNIVCQLHALQQCHACDMDWIDHNQLAHALSIKPTSKSQISELKEKGNTCYKANEPQKAIEHYTEALHVIWSRPLCAVKKEEVAVILSNRSAAYMMTHQFSEALVDAELTLKLRKGWTKAWFRKGKALMGLKRYEEAKKAYGMGLIYEENNQELLNALKQVNHRECL